MPRYVAAVSSRPPPLAFPAGTGGPLLTRSVTASVYAREDRGLLVGRDPAGGLLVVEVRLLRPRRSRRSGRRRSCPWRSPPGRASCRPFRSAARVGDRDAEERRRGRQHVGGEHAAAARARRACPCRTRACRSRPGPPNIRPPKPSPAGRRARSRLARKPHAHARRRSRGRALPSAEPARAAATHRDHRRPTVTRNSVRRMSTTFRVVRCLS